jgi:hypothetical protein
MTTLNRHNCAGCDCPLEAPQQSALVLPGADPIYLCQRCRDRLCAILARLGSGFMGLL